jgi:hypothetical protein
MMDNMLDHYQAVLRDLELRRSRCQNELAELDQTIGGIKKLLSSTASLFMATPATTAASQDRIVLPAAQKYAGMSVRWAILNLLAEDAPEPMRSSEIAIKLVEGGIISRGSDFAANVSAVISDMVNKRNEVERNDESAYSLSDNGRLAWAAIKHSPKYINRAVSATLQ